MVIPVDDPSEPCYESETIQLLREIEEHAKRELTRLERMPEAAGEYSMARTYLEWLAELPWSIESGKTVDIAEVRCRAGHPIVLRRAERPPALTRPDTRQLQLT